MTPVTHRIDIKTQIALDPTTNEPVGISRYQWRCACGQSGKWHQGSTESGTHAKAARSARNGGQRHVAAMERGTSGERASGMGAAGGHLPEALAVHAIGGKHG
jgi:hypothetical protein